MDKPKRILVVQLKRAGDVIVTTPVLPALRKALPGVHIDFLVDKAFAPLLLNNPFIDKTEVYDRQSPWKTYQVLRASQYAWILDFQSSPRSILAGLWSGARVRAGYRVTFWGRFLSFTIKRPGHDISVTEGKMDLIRALLPEVGPAGERQIFVSEAERVWATQVLSQNRSSKSAIGLIPTHRRLSRRWPAESFVAVGRYFVSKQMPVWLFWGPGEEDYVSGIQKQIPQSRMIPNASMREMAALLEQCRVVITNDNGPMHVAEAVGAPTVTIYGPTDPTAWNAGGPRHRIARASELPCIGCNLNECPFGHECMTQVTPERVIQHAEALMSDLAVGV